MKRAEGLHVGIIMDGNGRWAARQGLSRYHGHHAGSGAVRDCVRAAPDFGVRVLTLYAFSSNNWRRPAPEVRLLLRLFERHLHHELRECVRNGVRVQIIGRRDRLGPRLCDAIGAAEQATRGGQRLLLRLAIDYSARDAILAAAERLHELPAAGSAARFAAFGKLVSSPPCECQQVQDVDLIIRTGGEHRLSDFLLWEGAYAELYFTNVMWPEFGRDDLQAAIAEFHGRERRFGCVPVPSPAVARGGAATVVTTSAVAPVAVPAEATVVARAAPPAAPTSVPGVLVASSAASVPTAPAPAPTLAGGVPT